MRPGAPGPAPASQTVPGEKAGKGSESSRAKPGGRCGRVEDMVGLIQSPATKGEGPSLVRQLILTLSNHPNYSCHNCYELQNEIARTAS